jgi:hypothetical protein
MLVMLSPAAVVSNNVRDEITFALEEGKTVIPVLYAKCDIPLRLRRLQYLGFKTDYEHRVQAWSERSRARLFVRPRRPKGRQGVCSLSVTVTPTKPRPSDSCTCSKGRESLAGLPPGPSGGGELWRRNRGCDQGHGCYPHASVGQRKQFRFYSE